MNLGLVRREQPDAALTSDIEKVRVIMKNQEYTYIYGNRGIQNNEEIFKKYFKHMIESGINIPPSQYEALFLSVAHTEEHINIFLEAFRKFNI